MEEKQLLQDLAGGTFAFETAPTDGAVIDSSTGIITAGDYDTTYSVSYTTNGDCPTTTIVSVTSLLQMILPLK